MRTSTRSRPPRRTSTTPRRSPLTAEATLRRSSPARCSKDRRCSWAAPARATRRHRPPRRPTRSPSSNAVCARSRRRSAAVEAAGGYAAILIFNRTGADACRGRARHAGRGEHPDLRRRAALGRLRVVRHAVRRGRVPRRPGHRPGADRPRRDRRHRPPRVDTSTGGATSAPSRWARGKLTRPTSTRFPRRTTSTSPAASVTCRCTRWPCPTRSTIAAYLSYYAGGFRVITIDDGEIVERGTLHRRGWQQLLGGPGVQRDGVEYVAASDRDFGLYIFRYTGP